MIDRLMATAGPLPSDIQPVENETRDRIITGLVTLIPFVREIVPQVDVAGGRVVVDSPEGLLD